MANVKYLSYDGLAYVINKIKESTLKALSESISYSDLFDLVENEELIPGKKYRINDYYTIVNTDRTYNLNDEFPYFTMGSIGMDEEIGFDIVVTALSNNKLSEEAYAIDRDNDYFSTSNLSAWKIWYTIYNDSTKYSWANEDGGMGVIYRMIDEYGNDCPYDFKSIKYYDEDWGRYVFTFTWIDEDDNVIDASIFGNDGTLTLYGEITGVTNNIIKPYYSSYDIVFDEVGCNKQFLNNIVFITDYNYEGSGNEGFCGYNFNNFGNCCYYNRFNNGCSHNNFGNCCYYNRFEGNCRYNIFGNYCYWNEFNTECEANIFGNYCNDNRFGISCCNNILSNSCFNNGFDDSCYCNNLGNACEYNLFDTGCSYNSLGNCCYDNTLGKYCCYNSFGNNCVGNIFKTYYDIFIKRGYCCYNHFDDGCSYNIIWNNTTANSSNKLQNVHIKRGVKGTYNANNNINITTLNNNYCITVANPSNGGDLMIYCEEDYMLNDEIDTIIENIFINN